MGDDQPAVLSYAGVNNAFWRRLAVASKVVGLLVILANAAIVIGGWDDLRVHRAMYGLSSRTGAGFVILLTEAALSILAGGYLMFAAWKLRDEPVAGVRHHRWYAAIKLLLAGFAVAGGVLTMDESAAVGSGLYSLFILIQLTISAAYPLTILLLLRQNGR